MWKASVVCIGLVGIGVSGALAVVALSDPDELIR
jgi:hypothetical protein